MFFYYIQNMLMYTKNLYSYAWNCRSRAPFSFTSNAWMNLTKVRVEKMELLSYGIMEYEGEEAWIK